MKYKAIIFDLDGTLIDSKNDVAKTTNATLAFMGVAPLPEEVIYRHVGRGVRDLIKASLGEIDDVRYQLCRDYFYRHYWDHCLDETVLYPGVRETLERFRSLGLLQAVHTNKPQVFTVKVLKGLAIEGFFKIVLGAEDGYPYKPDAQGTLHILESLGVPPQKTLMVGDSIIDLETAQNVDMDCALMVGGYSTRAEILALKDEAVCLCETFAEVTKFVTQSYSTRSATVTE